MGSPLAVFLALRGIRPGTSCHQDHILPTAICSRLFNVFHPTDPVVSPSWSLQLLQMLSLTQGYDSKIFLSFLFSPHTFRVWFMSRNFLFLLDLPFSANRNQICNPPSQDVYIKNVQKFSHWFVVWFLCSGLQTGTPHPQTLQQYCPCSDTLVRT